MSTSVPRICFVGDSYTAGTGDPACLSWVGRVCAKAWRRGDEVTSYNLGVRGDTTAMIAARWRAECEARLQAGMEGRLVFSFGINDIARPPGGETRLSAADSAARAAAVMSEAKAWLPTIWVGPTPANEKMSPMSPGPGIWFEFSNDRLLALNATFKQVASELGIPFLDLATPLSADADYQRSLLEGDRMHCSAEGYELIAEAVDAWPAWRALSRKPLVLVGPSWQTV